MTMNSMKQQPRKRMKNARLTQTYRYSPLYFFSHQSSSDSKSQTSIISSSSNQSKNSNRSLRIHPASDDQHIIDLFDNISNNGDITVIEDSDLQPLALYVRESKQRATLQKNFDQADNLNDLLSSIKGEISNRSKNMQDQLNTQRTNYEAEDAKNMNEEMQNIHAQALQEFDNGTNDLINELIKNQQCEKNSFEYDWENIKTTKYRKPSTALLQMKEIEKSAIIAGDVSRARQMHIDIEKQTQKEANEQIIKYNQDYSKMKSRLIIKQQQEMERIKQNREELREIIVTKQELDKEVYEKRINVLNNKDANTKQLKYTASEPGNDVYGCSLLHIMQETQFGIDPLLPELPQQKNKTGPNSNSNSNQNKKYNRSRPSSISSPKRGSSVQIGNRSIGKFKWTLVPSNDPKYRTITDDSKLKKKDTFKYVKKPQFNKLDYSMLQSSPKSDKVISKTQSQNSTFNSPKGENIQKTEKNKQFSDEINSNPKNAENNIIIDKNAGSQKKKYAASDTNEIKLPLDDTNSSIEDDEIVIIEKNITDIETQNKKDSGILDEIFGSVSKLNSTSEPKINKNISEDFEEETLIE